MTTKRHYEFIQYLDSERDLFIQKFNNFMKMDISKNGTHADLMNSIIATVDNVLNGVHGVHGVDNSIYDVMAPLIEIREKAVNLLIQLDHEGEGYFEADLDPI